ncbi:MAG: BON domain-containing protein [Alphaproteobacteria bacterium]|mgnify:FL=1|jgi:osmotically-inducible protein OsmY|nr:BON domain-containing protein [Alphaproteobacteria bacterium]
MIKLTLLFVSLILLMINIGCSPVGILASGGGATMVIAEGDRSLGTVVDDATIKLNLSAKFLKSENRLFLDVNSNVTEGRVLLTGLVDTQEIRIEAVRKVWEINGVREVINEIEVGNKTTLKEYMNDLWINTQVKSLAARTIGLRSFSYNFETIKGKVYIAGITSRPEQLQAIVESTKTIKGVNEIVNYVIIKE